MAQIPEIIKYDSAKESLINTISYFLREGIPAYQIQQILETLMTDINTLATEERKKAKEEYEAAIAAEKAESEVEENLPVIEE